MLITTHLDTDAIRNELLGAFSISDGVSEFSIGDTWVDSWLVTLARGIVRVPMGGVAKEEVLEEPMPVVLQLRVDRLVLEIEGARMEFNANEFEVHLRDAIRDLLLVADGLVGDRDEPQLLELERYVASPERFS